MTVHEYHSHYFSYLCASSEHIQQSDDDFVEEDIFHCEGSHDD